MKTKEYEKPTMQVVEIDNAAVLMTSGMDATRFGYGDPSGDNMFNWGLF